MKRLISIFIILIAALSFAGCNDGPRQLGIAKIIAVTPHHATRVVVIHKDKNGFYYADSIHHLSTVSDGTTTIHPHDYLDGRKPYGPLPECEKEYQDYLTSRKS